MQKIFLIILITALALSTYSCSTLIIGCDKQKFLEKEKDSKEEGFHKLWQVYTRTHLDLQMIYFPFWAFFGNYKKGGDMAYAKTYAFLFGPFMIAFAAVDLPVAVVWDTITLPFDLRDQNEEQNGNPNRNTSEF